MGHLILAIRLTTTLSITHWESLWTTRPRPKHCFNRWQFAHFRETCQAGPHSCATRQLGRHRARSPGRQCSPSLCHRHS
ncbi:hypothetical protein GDO81_012137 [Engystomops pustulosus]|uniref:Secreted protein n=1 Tax=Engystomops pustulosus TaxID=76066 RepID=A0AAV7BJD3_ENGPU|nr:hypothetical protein GDO81_012137 [Engystomops pustulosus]